MGTGFGIGRALGKEMFSCFQAFCMGDIGVEGSRIYSDKQGPFWEWSGYCGKAIKEMISIFNV